MVERHTVVLTFDGVLQAWGVDGRFSVRSTRLVPTKSGVVGLINCAAGTRPGQPGIIDPVGAVVTIRADRAGQPIRDYHIVGAEHGVRLPRVESGTSRHPSPSERWYLSDAAFTVFVETDPATAERVREALTNPQFQLFLGRRSCPPAAPVLTGLTTTQVPQLVTELPVLDAAPRHRNGLRLRVVDEHAGYERDVDQPVLDRKTDRRRFTSRPIRTRSIEFTTAAFAGRGVGGWQKREKYLHD